MEILDTWQLTVQRKQTSIFFHVLVYVVVILTLYVSIVKSKHGEKLRKSGSLSYTRLHECFKGKLEPLDFLAECLKVGGAVAAPNGGVPDRLFKKHGRWKSDSAKDGYVKDSLQARLAVSSNLGL